MSKKTIIISSFALILALIAPQTDAYSPSYKYRSTVMGSGVRTSGGNSSIMEGEKYCFQRNESIFFLTRIYDIKEVDRFQFRHDIVRTSGEFIRDAYSPVYSPYRNWWSETYYWNGIEPLPEGSYELRAYISIDGGSYQQLDRKRFDVGNGDCRVKYEYNYSDETRYGDYRDEYDYGYRRYSYGGSCDPDKAYQAGDPCNPSENQGWRETGYNARGKAAKNADYRPAVKRAVKPIRKASYRRDPVNYSFSWTTTGAGIINRGGGRYQILREDTEFGRDDVVNALTKISNIKGVDSIQIKHELVRQGGGVVKASVSGEKRLGYAQTGEYYAYSNLGRLDTGTYDLKTYIRLNGGSYTYLNTRTFTVTGARYYDPYYRYGWTKTDDGINHPYGYTYEMPAPKSDFFTDEDMIVLTSISNIRGIDYFTIRHAILKRGSGELVRELDARTQYPHYQNWPYSHSYNNFGKLPAGDYDIRVYVSVNGGGYRQLDTKQISVKERYAYSRYDYGYYGGSYGYYDQPRYDYAGTRTGTGQYYY